MKTNALFLCALALLVVAINAADTNTEQKALTPEVTPPPAPQPGCEKKPVVPLDGNDNQITTYGVDNNSTKVQEDIDAKLRKANETCTKGAVVPTKEATCQSLLQRGLEFCSPMKLNFTSAIVYDTPYEVSRTAMVKYLDIFGQKKKCYPVECELAYERAMCAKHFMECNRPGSPRGSIVKPCRSVCMDLNKTCDCLPEKYRIDCTTNDWSDDEGCNVYNFPKNAYKVDDKTTPEIKKSSDSVAPEVGPGEYRDNYFRMDAPSAFIVEVKPVHCNRSDPLDVFIKFGSHPSKALSDWSILTPFNGMYHDVIIPDIEAGGDTYISVRGSDSLTSKCQYSLNIIWGMSAENPRASVCTVATGLDFCSEINNKVNVINYNMQQRDETARQLFEHHLSKNMSSVCQLAMKHQICNKMFRQCDDAGLPMKECRSQCEDFATTCSMNPYGPVCDADITHPSCQDDNVYATSQCSSVVDIAVQSCLNNCTGQGMCNGTSKTCVCKDGYTGDDCSTTRSEEQNQKDGKKVSNVTIIVVGCTFGVILIAIFGKIIYDKQRASRMGVAPADGPFLDPSAARSQQQQPAMNEGYTPYRPSVAEGYGGGAMYNQQQQQRFGQHQQQQDYVDPASHF